MTWNPNAPDTLGVEWLPTANGAEVLDANGKVPLEAFRSSSAQTVTDLALYLNNIAGDDIFGVDVYPEGAEAAVGLTSGNVLPRTDTGSFAPDWRDIYGGSANYFEVDDINDDGPRVQNFSNVYIDSPLAFRMGAGGPVANFTGKRVLRVELWVRWRYDGGTGVGGSAALEEPGVGIRSVSGTSIPPLGPWYGNTRLARLDTNPFTGLPWTAAEANAYFSNASTLAAGLMMSYNSLSTAVHVSAVWANVTYCDEARVAFSNQRVTDFGAADGWKTFPLTKPDGSASWAKANGTRYAITLRRVGDSGSVSWPYVDAPEAAPNAEHGARSPIVGGYGLISDRGALLNRIRPVRMIVGGSDSSDSQPYVRLDSLPVFSSVTPTYQEIDQATAANDYGFIRAAIRPAPASPFTLDDLIITLRRESDSAVMGAPFSVTRLEVDALPDLGNGWKRLAVPLDTPAALAASTRYRVELTTVTGDPAECWQVAVLTTLGAPASSYRGATNCASWAGLRDTNLDLALTLATVPDPPAGFTVTLVP